MFFLLPLLAAAGSALASGAGAVGAGALAAGSAGAGALGAGAGALASGAGALGSGLASGAGALGSGLASGAGTIGSGLMNGASSLYSGATGLLGGGGAAPAGGGMPGLGSAARAAGMQPGGGAGAWLGTPPFNPNAPAGGGVTGGAVRTGAPVDWRSMLMNASVPSRPERQPMQHAPLQGGGGAPMQRSYVSTPSAAEMRARRRGIPANSMLGMLGRG